MHWFTIIAISFVEPPQSFTRASSNNFFLSKFHFADQVMATHDVHLPSDEELTVPEVNLSSPALRAGAFHMGKYCENQNNVSIWCFVPRLHHQPKQTKNCRNSCCARRSWMIHGSAWQRVAPSPLVLSISSGRSRRRATRSSVNTRIAWIRAAAIWISNSECTLESELQVSNQFYLVLAAAQLKVFTTSVC